MPSLQSRVPDDVGTLLAVADGPPYLPEVSAAFTLLPAGDVMGAAGRFTRMSTRGIPKKSARLFRITQAVFALLFGGVAAWLFATSRAPVVAWILAIAAGFALVDVIVGWRPSRD